MSWYRLAVLIALGGGAAGSLGSFLHAAERVGAPWLVLILIGLWVLSPFGALALAHVMPTRWAALTRAAIDVVTIVVGVVSSVIYAATAFGAGRPKTSIFVIVAPASWLLIAIVVATAAIIARRRRHRVAI